MAKTANETLLDLVTHRSVNLHRFSEGVRQSVVAMLRDLRENLISELQDAGLEFGPTEAQQIRLNALLQQTNETISSAYQEVNDHVHEQLVGLAKSEARYSKRALDMAIPVDLPTVAIGEETLAALTDNLIVLGRPLENWWEAQAQITQIKFAASMRQGILRGDTTDEMARLLRAPESEGGAGMELTRAQAETLVRSSVSTVANEARQETWKANKDLVKYLMWLSTLDARTTIEWCIPRDHMLYDVETLEPVGHGLLWEDGPGRIHPNCRSTSVPILRSAEELGLDLPELPEAARSSLDGYVPASKNYEEWLKTQSQDVQNEALGEKRAALWREGRVGSLRDLLDQSGRPLTLKELEDSVPTVQRGSLRSRTFRKIV